MRLLLTAAAILALTACGRGTMITSDGRMLSVTPENVRLEQQRTLVERAQAAAGSGWTATAVIAEDPVVGDDAFGHEDNHWEKATVAITLTGAGELSADGRAAVVDAVRTSMRPHVRRPSTQLVVTVATAVPAQAPQPVATPAPQAPAATPASAGRQTYAIQAGDTLATISAVFYGDAKHWRRIVDANPGLDPARLQVGASIVIPPATAP